MLNDCSPKAEVEACGLRELRIRSSKRRQLITVRPSDTEMLFSRAGPCRQVNDIGAARAGEPARLTLDRAVTDALKTINTESAAVWFHHSGYMDTATVEPL